MTATACGTRLNERAVRRAQARTSTVVQRSTNGAPADDVVASDETTDTAGAAGGTPTTSGGKGRTAPKTVAGGTQTGVTADAIKIGGIFPLSGGLNALGAPVEKAARAYFRSINDAGGIGGRKIDFIAADDGADPTRTRTAADRLVNQDHIFAMGPSFTPFSPDLVAYLEQRGVPFIGFDGVNVEGFASSSTVTIGASIAPHADVLIPYWYEKTKAKRIGVVYLDVPPARAYLDHTKNTICPKLGCQVVAEQAINFQTTEFGSILLAMQRANAEGIFIVTDPASAVKMLLQAKQINYKPSPGGYLGQHGIYLDLVPDSCGSFCDGIIAPTSLFPPQVHTPATDQMRATISRYYSGVEYGYFTELGYVSARLLVDVLRQAGVPDRAKVLAVARGLNAYDSHGFTNPARPVDLTPGREHPRDMILVRMQGGTWVQETDWLPPRNF